MAKLYETDKLLNEYLLLHYGKAEQVLPWSFGPADALEFPARCVTERIRPVESARALELGCSVGRACFELSVFCDEVVGVDLSESFIRQARELKRLGEGHFEMELEGELKRREPFTLEASFRPDRVEFEVGDATALRSDIGRFDIVLACNVLCRVPDPQALLRQTPELVKPGGQLLITSPYTWSKEHTPKRFWLGGFEHNGQAVRSLDTIKRQLDPSFELSEVVDMPFLIREHSRKFQWSVAQASLWKRR